MGVLLVAALVASKLLRLPQLGLFVAVIAHEIYVELFLESDGVHVMFPMVFILGYWRASVAEGTERRLFVLSTNLANEQENISKLLEVMLPPSVISRLLAHNVVADAFSEVTVLIAEVDSFVALSESFTPQQLVDSLNIVYTIIEELLVGTDIFQVESLGEQALLVSGCPVLNDEHAVVMARFALRLLERTAAACWPDGTRMMLRVGMHSGPVMASVIGRKRPQYNIIGDTVNTAARMLSKCDAGCIRVSHTTRQLLVSKFDVITNGIQIFKGKGQMETFNLIQEKSTDVLLNPISETVSGLPSPVLARRGNRIIPVVTVVTACSPMTYIDSSHHQPTPGLRPTSSKYSKSSKSSNSSNPSKYSISPSNYSNSSKASNRSKYSFSPSMYSSSSRNSNASKYSNLSRHSNSSHASQGSKYSNSSKFASPGAAFSEIASPLLHDDENTLVSSPNSTQSSNECEDNNIYLLNSEENEIDEDEIIFQDDSVLYLNRTHLRFRSKMLEDSYLVFSASLSYSQQRYCFAAFVVLLLVATPAFMLFEKVYLWMFVGRIITLVVSLAGFAVTYWSKWPTISRATMILYGCWNSWFALYEYVWFSGQADTSLCQTPDSRWLLLLNVFMVFFELNGLSFFTSLFVAFAIFGTLLSTALLSCDVSPTNSFYQGLIFLSMTMSFSLLSKYSSSRKSREAYVLARRTELEKMLKSDLVENILPAHASEVLLQGGSLPVRTYSAVTLLFSDIVGFTGISAMLSPHEMRTILHTLYQYFDDLCEMHGVYKVATIGDAYIAAAGCPDECEDHAQRVLNLAFGMQEAIKLINHPKISKLEMRIGIHTGSVFAGLTGVRTPHFHLFGPSCHTAHTLESLAPPSSVLVSETTTALLTPSSYVLSAPPTCVSIPDTAWVARTVEPPRALYALDAIRAPAAASTTAVATAATTATTATAVTTSSNTTTATTSHTTAATTATTASAVSSTSRTTATVATTVSTVPNGSTTTAANSRRVETDLMSWRDQRSLPGSIISPSEKCLVDSPNSGPGESAPHVSIGRRMLGKLVTDGSAREGVRSVDKRRAYSASSVFHV